MIDYIKLVVFSQAFARDLRNNHLLENSWSNFTKEKTGNSISFANYKGLRFKIYPSGRVEIDGSLHKYYNSGEHNFNDYSYTSLLSTLVSLKNEFGDMILSGRIENIEYGLNIKPTFKADDFLKRIIVYLKRGARLKQPITKEDSKGYSKGVKFILDQYQIKIYNKGKQYNQGENLLRCEFKTVKMKSIEPIGLCYVIDLTDTHKLNCLHGRLMESYNDVLIREDVNEAELTKPEIKIYNECINADLWVSMDKHKRTERKAQYKAIVATKSVTDVKTLTADLLRAKHLELIQQNNKSTYLLTELLKGRQVRPTINEEHLRILKTHYLFTRVENQKNLPINHLYNV
jgi:hypothetical protein